MRRLRETFVRRVARISTEDAGFVALVVAICLPVFIALLAFAVDVSNWYLVQQKEQKAADDASLAGVIYLPTDPCTAYKTAFNIAGLNGFATTYNPATCSNSPTEAPASAQDAKKTFTVTVQLGGKPGELQVTIVKAVNNAFASIPLLNDPTTNVGKSATAAFAGPAAMGSPCNVLGNEDMESTSTKEGNAACGTDGRYWLEVAGHNVSKIQGDALQASWCSDSNSQIDGCTSTSTTEPGGTNQEYSPTGYAYQIHVPTSAPFNLEIFDGESADLGPTCTPGGSIWSSAAWNQSTTARNPFVTTAADANVRYGMGQSNYCAGDYGFPNGNSFSSNSSDGSANEVTLELHEPAISAADPLSGTVFCTISLTGYSAKMLDQNGSHLYDLLNQSSISTYSQAFAEYFHRWGPISANAPNNVDSIDSPSGCAAKPLTAAGDYVLTVSTGTTGGADSMFGLRGYYTSGSNAGVTITALQRVALDINNPSGNPSFHLVHLGSGAGGHTLTVQFYDFGDNPEQAAESVRVYAPDDSNLATNNTTPFSNCVGAAYPGSVGSLATLGNLGSQCQINITYKNGVTTLNGRWQLIQIALPTNYTCKDDGDPTKCWVRVQVFPPGDGVTDITTWGASLSGDPVRLVQ
jgi:Flp pilus assembly protein TadG